MGRDAPTGGYQAAQAKEFVRALCAHLLKMTRYLT